MPYSATRPRPPDAATGDGTNDDKDGGERGGESGDNGASNEPGRTVNDVAGESFLSHEEGDESLRVLGCDDLVALFRRVGQGIAERNGTKLVVGMVGYPNVGKSSTINVLCRQKKVAESATPGKTKHFQTIHLCEDIILCDCPGLVFPSFVSNTAEMVCNGLLPIGMAVCKGTENTHRTAYKHHFLTEMQINCETQNSRWSSFKVWRSEL